MKIYSSEVLKVKLNRRKTMGKVFHAVLWVLLALAVLCFGSGIYKKLILKSKSVDLFGYTPFIVASGSMRPSLQVNDIVMVRRVSESKISTGDIIAFIAEDGSVVTHRVARIAAKDGKNYYITRGDANNANDIESVCYENVIGRYSFKLPGGGYFVAAVVSPTGIAFFAILVILICFISICKSSRQAARHSLREKYKKQDVI